MPHALAIYGAGLTGGAGEGEPLQLGLRDGTTLSVGIERWLAAADAVDRELLAAAAGPVLDVGCGPGRHLHALAARGVFALGVDLSPVAVRLAVGRGGRAVVGDIFGHVPGASTWRTALLLDGNIGIGGSPQRLLARVGALLASDGQILVEVGPPGSITTSTQARLHSGDSVSGWFDWACVSACRVAAVAAQAGYATDHVWSAGERWFACLRRAQRGAAACAVP